MSTGEHAVVLSRESLAFVVGMGPIRQVALPGVVHGGLAASSRAAYVAHAGGVLEVTPDGVVTRRLATARLANTGCPVAALGSDMARQSGRVRQASAQRVERLIGAVRDTLPGATRSTASVIAGTLVGSLQLARALGDTAEGRAVLSAARKALLQQHDTASPAT